MRFIIQKRGPVIFANDAQRFELIVSLYKGLRDHLKSDRAHSDLASLTDIILRDEGIQFCISSGCELIRKIKIHTSLISVLQPFLLNSNEKCVCGHWACDHEPFPPGKSSRCKGKYLPAQKNDFAPCKHKCVRFERRPV